MYLLPEAAHELSWVFIILTTISVVYGAFSACVQTDLKYINAYSSVSHCGLVLFAVLMMNTTAGTGAVLQMLSHGLMTALFFALIGMIYGRTHTRDVRELSGLMKVMPFLAVGYVIAAVSWPEQVFQYPQPYTAIPLWDASAVPVSDTISRTLRSGGILNLSPISLVLGEYAAPMGTGAALVILACGLFLWYQKDTRLSAAVSFLVTSALIAFLFPRQVGLLDTSFAASLLPRLQCVRDELLTGAMLFSAVFLLNEPYTCAHHRIGRILYGVLVGAATMGFRYFGVYDTGVCFALLTVNSISGWLDRTETRLYRLLGWKEDAE